MGLLHFLHVSLLTMVQAVSAFPSYYIAGRKLNQSLKDKLNPKDLPHVNWLSIGVNKWITKRGDYRGEEGKHIDPWPGYYWELWWGSKLIPGCSPGQGQFIREGRGGASLTQTRPYHGGEVYHGIGMSWLVILTQK